jgi:hypothetical protein
MRVPFAVVLIGFGVSFAGGACASKPATPPVDPQSDVASVPSTSSAPTATAPTPSATASSAPSTDLTAAQHTALDVTEHGSPITLTPLFDKKAPKSSFPAATVGDRECWSTINLTGDHKKDYDNILARCGTPTGLREYVSPAKGRLHHEHDKRDTFRIKLSGGLCYRYFAVADAKITDLDILVETLGGALVADDKTRQPVAIIENDKPWCMDEDKEFNFHVEVDGPGEGFYMFGVWARPKK